MAAKQFHIRNSADPRLFSFPAQPDLAVDDKRAFHQRRLPAEEKYLGTNARRHRPDPWIIMIQNGKILLCLQGEQFLLGSAIPFKRAVPVDMIRRQIQHDRDVRPEFMNAFQLKAGDFRHYAPLPAHLPDFLRQGNADISADDHFVVSCLHHFAEQGCRRRLAIGSGNGNDRRLTEAAGQFDLAPDRNGALICRLHQWMVDRNPRREDQ